MSGRIEIYTKAHCPYCLRAKKLLRIKGVAFIEYDIMADEHHAAELIQRSQHDSVPIVFVNNRLVGDCAELFALDESGELDQLLKTGFMFAEFPE